MGEGRGTNPAMHCRSRHGQGALPGASRSFQKHVRGPLSLFTRPQNIQPLNLISIKCLLNPHTNNLRKFRRLATEPTWKIPLGPGLTMFISRSPRQPHPACMCPQIMAVSVCFLFCAKVITFLCHPFTLLSSSTNITKPLV